jgi:hypothetical protein
VASTVLGDVPINIGTLSANKLPLAAGKPATPLILCIIIKLEVCHGRPDRVIFSEITPPPANIFALSEKKRRGNLGLF